eukprot:925834-Amphidinium_carterae.1
MIGGGPVTPLNHLNALCPRNDTTVRQCTPSHLLKDAKLLYGPMFELINLKLQFEVATVTHHVCSAVNSCGGVRENRITPWDFTNGIIIIAGNVRT